MSAHPDRRLGVTTALLLVVASMIGTGVFTTTGYLLRDIRSIPAVLAAWVVGGVVALFGALAYGELVAALPHNGGEYQLLSRIYHPSIGFVSGWTSLVVGFSAPTAASAIAFAHYLDAAFPGLNISLTTTALSLVIGMSALHAFQVGLGGNIQNAFTIGKVVLIAIFVAGGIWGSDLGRLGSDGTIPTSEAILSPSFAIGLIYVSFAYSGWNAAAYIAGEVKNPAKNLPLALLLGTLLVTLLYFGVNVVFLSAAPAAELAAAGERVGHVAAVGLFGEGAGRVLSSIIALGLISTVGALVMTGPRIYEAMGRDYPALKALGRRGQGSGPMAAIALQAVVSAAMVLTATFDELLTYIGFTLSLFAALTVAGVFVMRARQPDLERPYRTWGHPVTSGVFILLMVWMIAHAVVEKPLVATTGLATLAVGFLVYLWARRRVGTAD